MNRKKLSLPMRILIALVLGVVVGLVCYFTDNAAFTENWLKPFGDIFVNLLKFIVVPVVLLSMIDGILSMDDMRKVGSVGIKTVLYFLCTTAVACVIGLILANIFKGAGLFPDLSGQLGSAEYTPSEYAGLMATIVAIGTIMKGDFQMFWQVTGNNPMVLDVTDVIDTYVTRSLLQLQEFGMTSAAGLYQSTFSFLLVLLANKLVKKVEPDYALF